MRRQGAEHPVVAMKSVKADGAKGVHVVKLGSLGQPEMGEPEGHGKTVLYFTTRSPGSLQEGEEQQGSSRSR